MTLKPGALLKLNMAYSAMSPCDRRDMVKRVHHLKVRHDGIREGVISLRLSEKDFITVLSGRPHEHTRNIINILIKECGLDKNEIWEG